MPIDDVSGLVASRQLVTPGAAPEPVLSVAVREIAATTDAGSVERHVLVSWRHEGAAPVRRFSVWLRALTDPDWEHAGYSITHSRVLCCPLDVGVDYQVAVVAEGPDGAHVPVSEATRAEFRLYGQEVVPPAPTGLRSYRVDDAVILTWDAVEYPSPVTYEVRVGGENWEGARHEALTRSTWIELRHPFPGNDVGTIVAFRYHVAAVTATGLRGSSAPTDVTLDGPSDQVVEAESDSLTGPWPGTKTGCAVSGTSLVVSAGETSATYESGALDAGASDEYLILAGVKVAIENVGISWGMALWSWGSAEAGRRSWDGGPAEWFPSHGIEWPGSPTWDEMDETWDDYGWLTWDSMGEPRDQDDPTAMTWDDADFTWDSAFAGSWTWDGPVSSFGTECVLEVATSVGGVSYSEWTPWAPESRTFRYLKWRLRIAQPVPALTVTVERVIVALVRTRVPEPDPTWTEETPAGLINGVNDTFTLSDTPDPSASFMLFKAGLLMIGGVDYTRSGTTIVYEPGSIPTGGQTHRARYLTS